MKILLRFLMNLSLKELERVGQQGMTEQKFIGCEWRKVKVVGRTKILCKLWNLTELKHHDYQKN